jgi:dTDP-glucose 4,6-dehydratase
VRRLLVTGGAGFMGSDFVRHQLREPGEARVVVLDALTYAGNLANLESLKNDARLRFVEGDICDRAGVEALLREERIDTIVHFAAETHVDRSIVAPDAFIRTNVLGTHALLEAARSAWLAHGRAPAHRFHHVSTDEVYGSSSPGMAAFREGDAFAPNSPYSASKASSDLLVRAYHRTYGLSVTTSNASNAYGAFQFPEKLIPRVIVNIQRGKTLPVYGDGLHVRNWLHVEDHSRAVEAILSAARPGETYNVAGGSDCENIQIVRTLCAIADEAFLARPDLCAAFPSCPASRGEKTESLIGFVADRPGHDRHYAMDCSRIELELGFRPAVTLQDGLRRTFQWYLDNAAWWRNV